MTPFARFEHDFTGKRVLIFGLGTQGRGVGDAKAFAQIGAKVTVSDRQNASNLKASLEKLQAYPISYHLGQEPTPDLLDHDAIIRNASVPYNHSFLLQARKRGLPIYEDACLFFSYAKPKKVVAITGTRGKTTTSHLILLMLQKTKKAVLAGNAVPVASLELLSQFDSSTYYVFELSSWQLQAFHDSKLSPPLSLITNLYPDHLLDRSFSEYIHDKTAIFAYQKPDDTVFFYRHNKKLISLASSVPGQLSYFDESDLPQDWPVNLVGPHNRANAAAALALARHLKLPESSIKSTLESFTPPPFRLQILGKIQGRTIINDTTSTTPIATIAALKTYPNSVLIIGGTSKNLPLKPLAQAVNTLAASVILLPGTGTQELKSLLTHPQVLGPFSQLSQAFSEAIKVSKPNQKILFSPAFASFGQFVNEFDRGEQFNQLFQSLDHA